MKSISPILLLVFAVSLYGQNTVVVRGRVLDDSTKAPVLNANVFIANSMMGTSSDTSGRYELKGVLFGSHELVASCLGYQMSVKRIQLFSAEEVNIDFMLKPKSVDLAPVEVVAMRPEEWKENLKKFTKLFLGTTREAEQCVLNNPESLVFFSDPSGGLEAKSNSELIVDNGFLGYRLYVNLGIFKFDGRWLTSVWKVRFEELLPGDDEQKSDWQERRKKAYKGSLRHFLRALINGEPSEEGFQMLYSESANIEKLGYYNPSLKRKHVLTQVSPNVWRIQFRNSLAVTYDRLTLSSGFSQPTYDSRAGGMMRMNPVYRPQVSLLSLQKESLLVDLNGQLLDNLALKISGDWAKEGLAKSLPVEYRGEEK